MARERRKRAVIVGFEYYGHYLARLINEHSDEWSVVFRGASYAEKLHAVVDIQGASALISFGGPGPSTMLAEAARRNNVPVIVIWAGTDVVNAAKDPGFLEIIKQERFINVSDGPWLVDELKDLGIEATYVPVTAVRAVSVPAPFPKRFRVLTYLPEPRRAFYGEKAVYAVAKELPDVQFTIVGKGERNTIAPKNVEFLGYVDYMPELIDDSVALLRLPEHDGKSMLVLETLARGRHVIWKYAFPGVKRAVCVSDAVAQLQVLYRAHEREELDANHVGIDHVRNNFSPELLARQFIGVLNEAAKSRSHERERRPHRVLISGYNLFSARVADAIHRTSCEWDALVIRGNRRLERVVSVAQLTSSDVWYTIGSPIPDRLLHALATLMRKPRVVHWVGSDVALLRNNDALRRWCKQRNVTHLAEVDWMVQELAAYGVNAHLAPLPPQVHLPEEPPPLPDKFTVLLYLPRSRGEFYGRREYERLFRAFAGKPVRFFVVGGGEIYAPESCDVFQLGWRTDLRSLYEKSSALVRFTQHDGLSLMALEALAYGRHVIWTKDFPFVRHVTAYPECEAAIHELLELHQARRLSVQHEAAAYIRNVYDPAQCINRIAEFWNQSAMKKPIVLGSVRANT